MNSMYRGSTARNVSSEITLVLRVKRFRPKPELERRRPSSPFAAVSTKSATSPVLSATSSSSSSSPFPSVSSSSTPHSSSSPFASNGAHARRTRRGHRWTQEYTLCVAPTDTLLDCLLEITRTIDPTLAFRYACGHGMCGSDAVSVNGTPTLLCTTTVAQIIDQQHAEQHRLTAGGTEDSDGFRRTTSSTSSAEPISVVPHSSMSLSSPTASGSSSMPPKSKRTGLGTGTEPDASQDAADPAMPLVVTLSPLPGFAVQRDLIVDIEPMFEQISRLKPALQADGALATTTDGKVNMLEYIQHPEELARYELLSNCIACGVCEGSCPIYSGGEAFIGPAALIAAARFINDSRDLTAQSRLDAIDTADGVAACQSVRACGRQCPRGIDVGEEMWQLITAVNERRRNDTVHD